MVCISAEIPVTIVLCLIQNGIQVIEGGRYLNSWVTCYLETLGAVAVFFIPPCHECVI